VGQPDGRRNKRSSIRFGATTTTMLLKFPAGVSCDPPGALVVGSLSWLAGLLRVGGRSLID
jgi:hypothetical protein